MVESERVKEWEEVGRRQELAECVLTLLQDKFGALPLDLPKHLREIDNLELLRNLHRQVMHAPNLDEFQKQIPNGARPKS